MLYADVLSAVANLLEIPASDPDFVAILPRAIDDAEQRCYRELNLDANSTRLSGTTLGTSSKLTPGNRNLPLTVGTFVVLESVNIITPATAGMPDAGVRTRLVRMSWDAMDAIYGSPSSAPPVYFALQDAATIAFGPWPDQAYPVEIIGTIRPIPLSTANTSTTLTVYFPDLFLAAMMVFLSAYTRNFGAQSADPQMAMSWEQTYQARLKSAIVEEARKKGVPVPGDV